MVGLDRLPSPYEYESEFEVLRPVDREQRSVVLVDAENRGGPSMLGLVTGVPLRGSPPSAVKYPVGMGDGCLFDTGLAYARVQWQTEHSASVPADGQGIGLVIVRDFGRQLAGEFGRRMLAGASQSAWFVNTLIAEGFNVDPDDGSGVYSGALSYLSAGNWLALNRLADDGAPQYPYVRPARATAHRRRDPVAPGVRPVLRRHHQLHRVLPAPGECVRVGAASGSRPSLRLPGAARTG